MKKPNQSILFIIAGILFLFSAVIGDSTNYVFATIGFALITIGISKRKKESDSKENSEEGELLTDEEEKKVWEEFQNRWWWYFLNEETPPYNITDYGVW